MDTMEILGINYNKKKQIYRESVLKLLIEKEYIMNINSEKDLLDILNSEYPVEKERFTQNNNLLGLLLPEMEILEMNYFVHKDIYWIFQKVMGLKNQ